MDQFIKSDRHPLSISNIPLFSPIRRLYEPEAGLEAEPEAGVKSKPGPPSGL